MQKIWILAIIVTFMMLGSGIAVLGSHPTAVSNGASVKGITPFTTQTTNISYQYPIQLVFKQKTNVSTLTNIEITLNISGSLGRVMSNFTNLLFEDYNRVPHAMLILSGTNNTTIKFIAQTPFVNSTDYLLVLPISPMYSELGRNVFLSNTINGINNSNVPSGMFLAYSSLGTNSPGDAIYNSKSPPSMAGWDYYTNGPYFIRVNYNYKDYQFQVNASTYTGNEAIYNPSFNVGHSNVSYGIYADYLISGYADYSSYDGLMPSNYQNFVNYGNCYPNSVSNYHIESGNISKNLTNPTSNAMLYTYNFTTNHTMEYGNQSSFFYLNNSYNISPPTTVLGGGVHVITANSNSYFPEITIYYAYAMTYHIYKFTIGTQSANLNGAVVSTGNYIRFNQTGLPAGQSWNVSVKNNSAGVNQIYSSTTDTLKAFLPTGYNYSFIFATFDQSFYNITNLSGKILLPSSSNATVNITLINETYFVNYKESGLNSGTSWSITLNGTKQSSTSAEMHFLIRNGTYAWSLTYSNLYSANLTSGTVTVKGIAQTISIGFIYKAYNVTFSEVGLPSGQSWSIVINSTTYTSNLSNGNTILFQGKSGSYSAYINNASYLVPVDRYANFTINGASMNITVNFAVILTFVESGFTGTWHITVNGKDYSSSTNTIVVLLPPGQYYYQVWGVGGYTITSITGSGTLTSSRTFNIQFSQGVATSILTAFYSPWILGLIIIAIIALAIYYFMAMRKR
jgi:hypothetical protein